LKKQIQKPDYNQEITGKYLKSEEYKGRKAVLEYLDNGEGSIYLCFSKLKRLSHYLSSKIVYILIAKSGVGVGSLFSAALEIKPFARLFLFSRPSNSLSKKICNLLAKGRGEASLHSLINGGLCAQLIYLHYFIFR